MVLAATCRVVPRLELAAKRQVYPVFLACGSGADGREELFP
jgi:hypothetical protein